MKVLIVDGFGPHAGMLERAYRNSGIDATGVTTLAKAAAFIRKDAPDLILWQADHEMLTAWKAIHWLRQTQSKRIYFVAMHMLPGGIERRRHKALCEECGADEFVGKPFELAAMLEWAGKAKERLEETRK